MKIIFFTCTKYRQRSSASGLVEMIGFRRMLIDKLQFLYPVKLMDNLEQENIIHFAFLSSGRDRESTG